MDENQQAAIDSCEKEIVGVLKHVLEIVLHDLYIEKAISDEEKESIQIISGMDAGKVNKLLRILKGKDNGWPKLLDYLLRNGYTLLATNLKTRALEHSKQRTTATVMEPPRYLEGNFPDIVNKDSYSPKDPV